MSDRWNPHAKNPCPHCRGFGFHVVSKDPDREVDCPDCRGTGEKTMTDPTPLSHATDPDTSATAALQLDAEGRRSLKEAIITLLDDSPRTDDELVAAYAARAEQNRWPLIADLHSVKRRRSELVHIHHVAVDTGDRRLSNQNRKSVVWALAVPAEEARLIVAMKGVS